jgi:hypothetical protein
MPFTRANRQHNNCGLTDSTSMYYVMTEIDHDNNKQNDYKSKNKGSFFTITKQNNNYSSFRSWWKRNCDKYNPSLVLENKASVARDNLGMLKKYRKFISIV